MIGEIMPPWKAAPGKARSLRRFAAAPATTAVAPGARGSVRIRENVHVLADAASSGKLARRASEIEAAFASIEPALRELAPRQFEPDFPTLANATLAAKLGFTLPTSTFTTSWTTPLDMRRLYAQCVLRTFCRLIERAFDRGMAEFSDGESAEALIHRWGFHAIDITPCADGRLSGVVDYILRVPPAVVVWKQSYAGAMFDVEESIRHWETVELRRWREGRPNAADVPTRFLKIGVYHFSSVDPSHAGCAAHGSDTTRAATALLERLGNFVTAIEQTHCCNATVATLLVGVDTDSDAIRVHVPDAAGRMDVSRFVDNAALYTQTAGLEREHAKDVIRDAVAACAGVPSDDTRTEGMRWFCGYLLKNNLGQVDAVRSWHGGPYTDNGHSERLIVVGDAVDDVQLRNLAFQAQMDTVEEGAGDLDIGVHIVESSYAKRGLAVPVLVHFRYDPRIPGADAQARHRARRLRAAILARYARQASSVVLHVDAVVRATGDSILIHVDPLEPVAEMIA